MAVNIITPESSRAITIEDLSMHELFRDWVTFITNEVNLRSIKTGTGSPEGVVEGKATAEYMDSIGTPGNIKYIKQVGDIAGDTTLGWILI